MIRPADLCFCFSSKVNLQDIIVADGLVLIMMFDVVFEHGNYLKLLSITKLLILIERLNTER